MDKKIKSLLEEIIKEEVMSLGPSSVEVGPVETDMDLMSVAQDMLAQDDLEGLEELVDLNNTVYTSIDRRDAWEAIGEQMLTAWGFDAPAQGKKAAASSGDSEGGGSVATFWDVKKGSTLYSVKTSFKSPTGPNNYKQATQSSNIKLTALFSAIKENPAGTMLGNIGCIYSEGENSRTVGWGNVTSPISSDDLKEKIRGLIEKNAVGKDYILTAYDELVGTATGKKMSKKEVDSAKVIIALLQKNGLVSSGARLTGRVEEFVGSYVNEPIASLKVYEPGYFYAETLSKKSGSRGGEEAADEEIRKNTVKRISTLTRGMSASQLDRLLSAAREMMQESLVREYIYNALLTEELTKTDKKEIERIAKKQASKIVADELDKALGASFFGTKGKVNKFVSDEVSKRFKQGRRDPDFADTVETICKEILKKFHRDMALKYPQMVDRIKIR